MDLAQLTDGLKSVSPYLATLVLIGALVYRWFDYREKKNADSLETDLRQNMLEIRDIVVKTGEGQQSVLSTMQLHSSQADYRFGQEIDLFRQILRQLISLNATATDGVSLDNAKLIVQYQWNWCRDETARVIANSIKNNHFSGDEERVARSVYRAWSRAASDSLSSVMRLRGITYPYQALYTHHITLIWEAAWDFARPVYYANRKDTADFENMLKDLEGLVCSLFDQVFDIHVELVEDVDVGTLYAEDGKDYRPTVVPNDITRPSVMAVRLATFKATTASDTSLQWLSPAVIKEKLSAHLQDRSKPHAKVKSSAEIPALPA